MYNVCVRLCTCTCMYILLVHVYCNLVRSDTCTVVFKCRGICKGLYNLDVHVHVCVCVFVCACILSDHGLVAEVQLYRVSSSII